MPTSTSAKIALRAIGITVAMASVVLAGACQHQATSNTGRSPADQAFIDRWHQATGTDTYSLSDDDAINLGHDVVDQLAKSPSLAEVGVLVRYVESKGPSDTSQAPFSTDAWGAASVEAANAMHVLFLSTSVYGGQLEELVTQYRDLKMARQNDDGN